MSFHTRPRRFVEGDEEALAIESLRQYFNPGAYTGAHFEDLIDTNVPYEITARDIVAVSMLGVNVPAVAAHWILTDGRSEVGKHLSKVDPEVSIWEEVDLGPKSSAWRLWEVLVDLKGVGPTTASKLMAAKRPNLLPIWDQHVVRGVRPEKNQYWSGWQAELSDSEGQSLRSIVKQIRDVAQVPESLSTLRVLDIIIWMRVHGWRWISDDSIYRRYQDPPHFWE